jgi:hypothetical protein
MAYTVAELITESWYLSGIVMLDASTPSGSQMNNGFKMLNAVLAFLAVSTRQIPYFTEYEFTGVVGQEEYTIANLIQPQNLTFEYSTVRYSMLELARDAYFGTSRANGINSLPYIYHVERALGGSKLWMYYRPDQAYEFKLWGKFALAQVTSYEQDLSLTLDDFYREYLRFLLSERMCLEWDTVFAPLKQKKLAEMTAQITDLSPIDLSVKKFSTLQKTQGLNYAQVNLGKGWTPS